MGSGQPGSKTACVKECHIKGIIFYTPLMVMLCTFPYPIVSSITYRKTSDINHTLVGNKVVDNSDVVGALPVGAAPTISSFST